MIEMILGIAAILIVVILVLIFRIHSLIAIMRGSYQKTAGMSNKVNAFLLLAVFILGLIGFVWITIHSSQYHLPEASSDHGRKTDLMFWVTMAILSFAFIVTNIFLFFFSWKYQYVEGRKAYFYPENHKLEVIWTVIPAIVMAILVFYGWKEWSEITKQEPGNSEIIEVMGKQFAWQVRYPGPDNKLGTYNFKKIDATNEFGIDLGDSASYDDFVPRELHMPVGKPVLLRIRARDVLHSVYMPHFRVKMDAVPGMPTKFWFKPNKTTAQMRDDLGNPEFNYELACAEICGNGHYAMRFIIVVDEPAEYEKWKKEQKTWVSANRDYAKGIYNVINGLLPAPPAAPDSLKAKDNTPPADSVKATVPEKVVKKPKAKKIIK
jgi:cytochrome c oxidase subunit 2